ncbi:MAG: T9SS type A sorting domain-containing protein [Cyclobacteriaceae bacterium]
MGKNISVLIVSLFISVSANAQLKDQVPVIMSLKSKKNTICYSRPEDQNTIVAAPQAYQNWRLNKSAKTNATTFEVEYVGFPPEAEAAFQKAVDIWSTLIETEVPIRIVAVWQVITDGSGSSNNILGGANPGTFIRDFDGAQRILTWYPVALAEKMANKDFNDPTDPDVFAQFNSAYPNWYLGIDGVPQAGKTDLVTVVLHEIGHGLGITNGYTVSGDNGQTSDFFSGLHLIYDHFLESNSEQNLVRNFTPPSSTLKTELTSGSLWFRTPQLEKTGGGDNRARVFAPNPFQAGSSIAHLDELSYNGSLNALMTPQIGTAEVNHNPGPVAMKIFADIGWVHTRIVHTRLPNIENVSTPYEVKATILADQKNQTGAPYGYNSSEVKLNYTTNGTSFTTVSMNATGNPNEFSATIPSTGSAVTYGYYISVKDNLARTILKPGILAEDGEAPINFYYVFEAGPDSEVPFINHTPQPFILADDTELTIEAIISDNIGVLEAALDYQINGVDQTPLAMTLKIGTDSTYAVTIPLPVLQNGDKVSYRIRAKDSSIAQNIASKPSASGFIELNVVSLAATQDSYSNDFNSPSSDFFGDNVFAISKPVDFSNEAIHTSHPYPAGTGTGSISNFIYQLRIPIRIKSADATLKFDEIVLVEPGENGSVFGDDDFWDYVIVEGSKDGGINWKPLLDGYDSRAQAAWLTKFNSSTDTNNPPNSTATGDPTLFRTRTIDMLATGDFAAADEIVIRFRLNTDQLVVGWGWAIDNLKIQIDDVAPAILHNHVDYLQLTSTTLPITMTVSDAVGVDRLFVDYKVNSGNVITEELPVTNGTSQYTLNINFVGLENNDLIEYRIRALDNVGNEATLPTESFFQVPIITFASPISQYIADFNTANTDFVGNFFGVSQPSGFTNGAIHSTHPYPTGFGLTNSTSSFSYTLKKPITISSTNPFMLFSEIVLVEYNGSSVKDFVIVEGSKDNGVTWQNLIDPYSALANSTWRSTYDAGGSGSSSLFRSRLLNLTSSGKFAAGDNVIIRFRLSADGATSGWGWAIDNLSIQGPITGIDPQLKGISLSVYPNPTTNGKLTVELNGSDTIVNANIQIINTQGGILANDQISLSNELTRIEYLVRDWANGVYFLRLNFNDGSSLTRKFIKSSH